MRGTGRFIVYSYSDIPLFDLSDEVRSAERREVLNGEHSLTIETSQRLEVGMRILRRDGTGKWREYVVDEVDEAHDGTDVVYGTYGATWSVQFDLTAVAGGVQWAAAVDGTHDPITASEALSIALSRQTRWQPGNVDIMTTAGASLYDGQVWDYLGKLTETWGGEIEPRIEVSSTGIVGRYVDWLSHVGSESVTRRFDFGKDCTSIRRKAAPGPYYCGIEPRGGNTGTDSDGVDYSARCGIEEEPDSEGHTLGSPYLFDLDVIEALRLPDGEGGYTYPCKVVTYSLETEGDQEELLNLARADLKNHTQPKVSYEADVLQFAAAGMDTHGVQLGDEVHIVDRQFGDGPLRLQARVTEMVVNELDESDAQLTIGEFSNIREAINSLIGKAVGTVSDDVERIKGGGTLVYLQALLDAINAELNVTGGYYYLVPGHGIYTYDTEVSNPLVGSEASQVTQVVGGGIRIANSRTQAGDWDWRSVFTSGHVAADVVTAANLVAGYIGNPDGSVYIDLDNGVLRIGPTALVGSGDTTVQDMLSDIGDARRVATDFLTYENGELVIGATNSVIRNVMTSSRNSFRTDAGDVAYFGLSDQNIWEMCIDTAAVLNRLRFNRFSWIARQNGNMSIKLTV